MKKNYSHNPENLPPEEVMIVKTESAVTEQENMKALVTTLKEVAIGGGGDDDLHIFTQIDCPTCKKMNYVSKKTDTFVILCQNSGCRRVLKVSK